MRSIVSIVRGLQWNIPRPIICRKQLCRLVYRHAQTIANIVIDIVREPRFLATGLYRVYTRLPHNVYRTITYDNIAVRTSQKELRWNTMSPISWCFNDYADAKSVN